MLIFYLRYVGNVTLARIIPSPLHPTPTLSELTLNTVYWALCGFLTSQYHTLRLFIKGTKLLETYLGELSHEDKPTRINSLTRVL